MTDGPIVPVRVMIVDDDPLILTVFTKELDAQPTVSVCATAAGGEQALETLSWRRHHIDVILLDISMPASMVSRPLAPYTGSYQTFLLSCSPLLTMKKHSPKRLLRE